MPHDAHKIGSMLRGMGGKMPSLMAEGGMAGGGEMPPEEPGAAGGDAPLAMAAQDLITAVHSKDVEGTKAALTAAFMFLESQDHEEGPPAAEEGAAPPMPE